MSSTTNSNNIHITTENQENNHMSNNTQQILSAVSRTQDEVEFTSQNVRDLLAAAAEGIPQFDEAVARHLTPKNKISLPEGMSTSKGAKILTEAAAAEAEYEDFNKTFKFRPWDGAAALVRVMRKFFGTSGRGKAIQTMFGTIPPQNIEIEISYGEVVTVPWGQISFEHLEGTLDLGSTYDNEYGMLFHVSINCPKKYQAEVHGFFTLLENELKTNSIYKGKAIRGTDNPKFLAPGVDSSIVYNEEVYAALDQAVWGPIRHTDLLRSQRVKVDPKVLLHGPYGTGKSEAGRMTAEIATDNGWTFISYNSGDGTQDDLKKTIQTARLLSPAVVFVEDVDIYAEDQGSHAQSRLLEMFDGISSKGHEVMIVMTSNKVDNLSKGMLRAGRINKMIEIGPLNKEATEKLIRIVNAGQLSDDLDFDAIWEATHGYEPAFIRQTFDDARQAALIRYADELKAQGQYTPEAAKKFLLTTEDFVTAANIMRPQHDKHAQASDANKKVTLGEALADTVVEALATRARLSNDRLGEIEVTVLDPAEVKQLNA